jgi:hypothetical protein
MLNQLKDVIDIFEQLHGDDCQGLFLFDRSNNHNAYPQDARLVSKLNMKDKELLMSEPGIRHGFYHLEDGTKIGHLIED